MPQHTVNKSGQGYEQNKNIYQTKLEIIRQVFTQL